MEGIMDLKEKKDLLHAKALQFKDASILERYEEFHESVIWQYRNDNTLSKLSSNYNVLMLPQSLQNIAQEFLSNKDFISVLIDMC